MECGARRCPPLSFCHEATNTCKDCADICDAGRRSHYEPGLCLENCRDYMYEQQRSPAIDGTARLLGAVGLGAGLVAVIGLLLLGGMVLFCVYRRPRQLLNLLEARAASDNRVDVDTPEMKVKMTNNNKCDIGRDLNSSSVCTVSGSISEPELRMNLAGHAAPQQPPVPALPQLHGLGGLSGLSPAVPPPPARHPSEDSTLDYAAYDNPALSPSSSPLPGAVGSAGGHPKAMDAVLEAVLDHSSLPGSVPRALHNGTANGSVARMESSF